MQAEARLQKKIVEALNGLDGAFFVRTRLLGRAGWPDITGLRRGRFVALEVKLPKPGSQATQLQLATLARIERAGGVAAVVRSTIEALDIVRKL